MLDDQAIESFSVASGSRTMGLSARRTEPARMEVIRCLTRAGLCGVKKIRAMRPSYHALTKARKTATASRRMAS